jgi:hypothetical protein
MCHDIEDPTFDATAAAIHPCAKIRPIHRPPRVPVGRVPHCHWTATIDESTEPYQQHANLELVGRSLLANFELDDPGAGRQPGGWDDLGGDRDVNFHLEDLSHRALVRSLQEIAIQIHLLARAFLTCVAQRWGDAEAAEFGPGVFSGVAGIGAERLRDEFALPVGSIESIAKLLQLHPVFAPKGYVRPTISREGDVVRFALGDAPCFDEADDYTWFASFENELPSHLALDAIAFAIDPQGSSRRVDTRPGERHAFEISIDPDREPQRQIGFVSLAKISTGASVTFIPRAEVRR